MTPKLRVIELSEGIGKLPDASAIVNDFSSLGGDLFISALGFEPRCLTIPNALTAYKAKFGCCVEMVYSDAELTGVQGITLGERLSELSKSVVLLK